MFASTDVAALVAAFPPTPPTKFQESLIRSSSGDSLFSSKWLLAKLRDLLETSPTRIRLTDLPMRLDIGTLDWLLNAYDRPLRYSKDKQSLLPETETEIVLSALLNTSNDCPVDLSAFATEHDVSTESLQDLILPLLHNGALVEFVDEAVTYGSTRHCVVYSTTCQDRIQERVRALVANRQAMQRIDLSQALPGVQPAVLLHSLARKALSYSIDQSTAGAEDKVMLEVGNVIYEPADYADAVAKNREDTLQDYLARSSRQLQDKGYCRVEGKSDTEQDLQEYTKGALCERYGPSIETFEEGPGCVFVVLSENFGLERQHLKDSAKQQTTKIWQSRAEAESVVNLQRDVLERVTDLCQDSEIGQALLKSRYREEVENVVKSTAEDLEQQEKERLDQQFAEQLLAPVQLYTLAMAALSDATLKQHLEEFLGDYFRREVVPSSLKRLQEQRLVLEKLRSRELDKMSQACNEANTLSEVQAALAKCAKKLKLGQAKPELLHQTKQQTLQLKAKAMQTMTRGSDLLQNLIWILLAQKRDGLFMSPGKDTSRMMKLYQTVGDAETGRKLERWRDMLKTGEEGEQDRNEMRALASRAFTEMYEVDDVHAVTRDTGSASSLS